MVKFLLVLLFFTSSTFAAIQVKVNKTQISSIDNLSVLISIDNLSGSQPLDVGTLYTDFTIVNRTQSSSFSSINGKTSSIFNLQLTLQPKRTGELIIPAFLIGGQTSKPVKIKVTNVDETSFEDNILFIKTQLNNTKPMVQQQVIYTVSLYSHFNITSLYSHFNITGTKLDLTPKIADAKVNQIADSSVQQVNFKGRQLWKKDFNFAIYPQKIGQLSIPGIKQAVLISEPKPQEVLLFASPTNLTVVPAYANYPAGEYWLPATNVELSEKPFDIGQKIIAGEPLVRQIIIKVSAQNANQVPSIKLLNSPSFEQYADSTSSTQMVTSDNIVSVVTQDILLIAKNSGEQTLPEINLTWFDTTDNKTKIARLPAIKVQVMAPLAQPKTLVLPKLEDKNIALSTAQTKLTPQPKYWKFIALFSIVLWLLSLLVYWLYRQSKPKIIKENKKTVGVEQLKMIKKYAKENNMQATKLALDAWIFECYGVLDTNSFAQQLSDDFASQVLILQQNLYKSNKQWDGDKFYQIFATAIKNNSPKQDKQTLSDLYPNL